MGSGMHSRVLKPTGRASGSLKPISTCVLRSGLVFGAEHEVYADTGFNAMRDQTFTKEFYLTPTIGISPAALEQTVIVFPSANEAQTVVASAQNQWRSCAGGKVDQSVPRRMRTRGSWAASSVKVISSPCRWRQSGSPARPQV